MTFQVEFVPIAEGDLNWYGKREQRIILDALPLFLGTDANIETRRRKRLRDNPLAPWELRIGDFRVFYEIIGAERVRVLASDTRSTMTCSSEAKGSWYEDH